MEEIKDITKFTLKIGDWLLVIKKTGKIIKWVYKILILENNTNILVDRYKIFEDEILKECKNYHSHLPDWDFKDWNWYKLNKKEIKKWKKIILIGVL